MKDAYKPINLHAIDPDNFLERFSAARLTKKWNDIGRTDGVDHDVVLASEAASIGGLFIARDRARPGYTAKASRSSDLKALHHKKMYAPVTRMTADEYNQLK
jgi:hypothetical protein